MGVIHKYPIGTIMHNSDGEPLYKVVVQELDGKYSIERLDDGQFIKGIYPNTVSMFRPKPPRDDKEFEELWV